MKPSPRHLCPRIGLLFFLLLQSFPAGALTRTPELAAAQTSGPVTRDARFGVNQAWEAPDEADRAGAGWSRLMFWWSALQPRGPQDWNDFATDHDSYIDEEVARGRELIGVV